MKKLFFYVLFFCLFLTTQTANAQSPGGVAGSLLWLRADVGTYEDAGGTDATEDGDTIMYWRDQSGNSRDGNEASSTPTWLDDGINFNPAINFDGTGEYVGLDNTNADAVFGGLTTLSYFMVQHTDTPTPGVEIGFFDDSNQVLNDEVAFAQDDSGFGSVPSSFYADSGFDVYATIRGNIIQNTPMILGTTWDDTASASIYLDGHEEPTAYYLNVFDGGIAAGDVDYFHFGEGVSDDAGKQYDGRTGEYVAYGSVLADGDIDKIESYMAMKYGITMSEATTTVILLQDDNTGNTNQISVVGQSFTATATTTVDGFSMRIWADATSPATSADLYFCVGEETAADCKASPDASVIGHSVTLPGSSNAWLDFYLDTAEPVYTGQQYTFVLEPNNFWTYYINTGGASYSGGRASLNSTYESGFNDLRFRVIGLEDTTADYLLSTGASVWDGTVNSTYHNDVAGIVEDTGSDLDQKISNSTEEDSLVIIATDQDFVTTNATTSRTSLGNGNAMMWGNDDAAVTVTGTFDGSANTRLDRIWKIEETGTVGNVYVAIPNTIGFSGTPYVVVSTDTTFTSADTVTALTDDGTYLYAQFNPGDGEFFTFAEDPTPILKIEFSSPTSSSTESIGANTPQITYVGAELFSPEIVDVVITGGTATTSDHSFTATTTITIPTGDYTTATTTVSVTGSILNDLIAEANETIEFTLISATSGISVADANTDGNTNATTTYTIVNDDIPGVTLSTLTSTVLEGATTSFTVVLDTEPTDDVIIILATSSIEASLSTTTLTFTSGDYNVAQTIIVTGFDDLLADGTQVATTTLTANSTDGFYHGTTTTHVTTVNDNDMASLTPTPSTVSVTEGGATSTYTVVLGAQPSANVDVILVPTTGEATTSSSTITFTMADYNIPQVITVTAVDDGTVDGVTTDAIVHTASSTDTAYHNLVATTTVNITDNDVGPTATIISPSTNDVVATSTDIIVQCNTVGDVYSLTGNFTPSPATTTCATVGTTTISIVFSATSTAQSISATVTDLFSNVSATTTVTGLLVDEDGDGVASSVEDAGFNAGDGNGDGILDSIQQGVSGALNPVTGVYTTLETAGACTFITENAFVAESSLVADTTADYPVGLVDFQVVCPGAGQSSNVTIYYTQTYDTSDWLYKKYDGGGNVYADITDLVTFSSFTFSTGTASGTAVTAVSFTVTDGDARTDEDGVADNIINDPSGPAVAVVTTTSSSVGGSSSGGRKHICEDVRALNYDNSGFGTHKQSLCEYENEQEIQDVISAETGLTCPFFTSYSRVGDTGNGVKAAQSFFKIKGFYAGETNGIFDQLLHQSVVNFQNENWETILKPWGIIPGGGTGYLYQSTRAHMNVLSGCDVCVTLDNGQKVGCDAPDVAVTSSIVSSNFSCQFDKAKPGDENPNVLKVQQFMTTQGFMTVTPNGYYGPATSQAVKDFQSAYPEIYKNVGLNAPTTWFYNGSMKKAEEVCLGELGQLTV